MKKNIKKIEFLKIKKIIKKKKEIKKKILKNIIQNNFNKSLKKIFFYFKLLNLIKKKNNKFKKICIITGRKKGLFSLFNLSRHSIKYLLNENKIQNLKIN